jgi:hypothetical protein
MFRVLVRKGDALPEGHIIELTGQPGTAVQTTLTWRIFRTELQDPVTVLDPRVKKLGIVSVRCPVTTDQTERKQTVRFAFLGSEIIVTVVQSNGETFGGVVGA